MRRIAIVERAVETRRIVAFGVILLLQSVALPPEVGAIENCKGKIDRRDGTLLISARGVAANPRWGFLPGEETNAFFNEAECIRNGRARKCTLGGPDTTERITPPHLCTVYVVDDSSTDCAAYVKGCVPGVRDAAQGPPGPPGPQGPGFVVRDVNGSFVGAGVSIFDSGLTHILREIGGTPVRFSVVAGGLKQTALRLYYESNDCTGQVLLTNPQGGDFVGVGQVDCGDVPGADSVCASVGTVYYPSGPATSLLAPLSQASRTRPPVACATAGGLVLPNEMCCMPDSTNATFAAATSLDLATLGLTAPFHIEVR